ncbi:MAG: hypothetical protein Q9168_000268 [Polycauliona sp. 1 TL-2023]
MDAVRFEVRPETPAFARVTVKDDNRGLGAKNGFLTEDRPTIGLDGLQDLLGRLNGKDVHLLQDEQRRRADARTAAYAGKRWGLDNFVSGGLLVGDRLQQLNDISADPSTGTDLVQPKDDKISNQKLAKAGNKKTKKAHKAKGSGNSDLEALDGEALKTVSPELTEDATRPDKAGASMTVESSALATEERIQRSERKARRKARRAEKTAANVLEDPEQEAPRSVKSVITDDEATMIAVPPTARGYGRHAGRQRSLRHKQMSSMDPKALNEILMIRA